MSVDPAQPSASDPTPPKSPADPAAENVETLRQKRRFKRGGEEPEGGEKPDAAIEVLSSLLQDLVAKKEHRPPPAEPAAAPPKAAKYHRLSKTGSGHPAAPAEGGPAPAEAPLPSTGGPAASSTPAAPAPAAFRPAPAFESEEGRRLRVWRTLALLCFLALVGLTVYTVWFARPAGGQDTLATRSGAVPAAPWTDESIQQLDQALAADQAGDLAGAQRLASAIKPPDGSSGLSVYLASLSTRLQRHFDAEADLLRLSKDASPEAAAVIGAGLGFNFSRSRDFEKAANAYKTAIRNDPFSASLFYDEGETARRLGHLPDAVVSFRRALDRVPTGQPEMESLRECINLKLRLTLAELGKESEFQAELDEQLKAPSPSGYWLLAAAAVALQHKDLPAAAGLLGRARAALGPGQFEALLNDYFFRTYADRKELADFFPDPATRRAKLLPSMTHNVEP